MKLNPRQTQASNHLQGPLLILAGAGSGKTRVITERTRNLIARGVAPEQILCLTFTRKAAKEMQERILKIKSANQVTQDPSLKKITITTFHSFCLILLKKYHHYLDLFSNTAKSSKSFTICDPNDQNEALANVLKELKPNFNKELFNQIKTYISQAKNTLKDPSDMENSLSKKVWGRYQQFLNNRKMIDFDDLLQLTYKLLSNHPNLRERLHRKYNYIMVDEYQDTNLVQNHILSLLLNSEQNLMVVGDDDQSIYSWRGARIENILNFEQEFPQAKTIKLEKNYRSTRHIVDAANGLIKNNDDRKEKHCISAQVQGIPILILTATNEKDEGNMIAENIKAKVARHQYGTPNKTASLSTKPTIHYGQFTLLYRTKQQSKVLQQALYKEKIPYRVWGELNFFDRKEIRDLLAYIKWLVHPEDDLSFLRIANKPKRFREKTLAYLQSRATEEQNSIFSLLEELGENEQTPKKVENYYQFNEKEITAKDQLIHAVKYTKSSPLILNQEDDQDEQNLIITSPKQKNSNNLSQELRDFISSVNYYDSIHLANEPPETKERRLHNINRFYDYLTEYQKKSRKPSLENFLLHINFSLNEDSENIEMDMINLMTIHASKGLEFPYVYIAGLEENILPFKREDEESNIPEERRLLYVAITRAQYECTLSLCNERKYMGEKRQNPPSRFLKDLPEENISHAEPIDKVEKEKTDTLIMENALKEIKQIFNK